MKQHYYLVSSLFDLLLDGKAPVSLENFMLTLEDLLDKEEFHELRKLFLVNDIKVALQKQPEGHPPVKPVCWSKDQLAEMLQGVDFSSKAEADRARSKLGPVDAALSSFYANVEAYVSQPLADWFLFELELRNVTTALALRKRRQPFHESLIPVGYAAQQILTSSAIDFGLTRELPYMSRLIEIYEEKQLHSMERDKASIVGQVDPDLLVLEKYLDSLRWDWLTENWEAQTFGTLAVYSYTLKLAMVERWNGLSEENGEKLFNKLVNQIKGSIVFSDDLFIGRGKK
ncbi:MAG: DUF2764 family protein [Spirochaetales bacterium]|nr:DUF2764 family protein [Spirochaetales bacterium]